MSWIKGACWSACWVIVAAGATSAWAQPPVVTRTTVATPAGNLVNVAPGQALRVVPWLKSNPITSLNIGSLSVKCHSTWVEGPGYLPVFVELAPTLARTTERRITIMIESETHRYYGGAPCVVTREIVIPAGSSAPVSTTVLIPRTNRKSGTSVRLIENGRDLPRFPISIAGQNSGYWGGRMPEPPGVVLVGMPDADPTPLFLQLPGFQNFINYRNVQANGPVACDYLAQIGPEELPTEFLTYSNADLIFVPREVLLALPRQHPARFDALCRWATAGGNLLVTGVDSDEKRAELLKLLRIATPEGENQKSLWKLPDAARYGLPIREAGAGFQDPYQPQANAPPEAAPERPKPADPGPFRIANWGRGSLTAIVAEQPFPGEDIHWQWLINSLTDERVDWVARHGVDTGDENQGFWNWMIPGVGRPPLVTFRVLITAFALIIGPINYFWLRRLRKMHLILITVPAFAAVVTGVLLGYAFLSDGLGVRTRVRSFTEIDQRRGEATCWARSTYYAGLAPSEGLRFASDVAVYHVRPTGTQRTNEPRKMLHWDDDQRFARNWLISRNPAQFVTVRARATPARLDISRAAGAATPTVENQLGTRIQRLLVVGPDGSLYFGENLAPGESIALTAGPGKDDLTKIQHVLRSGGSVEALDQNAYLTPAGSFKTAYVGSGGEGQADRDLQWLAVCKPEQLEPSSYLAIVDRSPEYDPGLPDTREEASLHVILGHW